MIRLDSLLTSSSVEPSTSKMSATSSMTGTSRTNQLSKNQFLLPAASSLTAETTKPKDRLLTGLFKIGNSLATKTNSVSTPLLMQQAVKELVNFDLISESGTLQRLLDAVEAINSIDSSDGAGFLSTLQLDVLEITPDELAAAIDSLMATIHSQSFPAPTSPIIDQSEDAARTSGQSSSPRLASKPVLQLGRREGSPHQFGAVQEARLQNWPGEDANTSPNQNVSDAFKPSNSPSNIVRILVAEAQQIITSHPLADGLRATHVRLPEADRNLAYLVPASGITPLSGNRENQVVEKAVTPQDSHPKTPTKLASHLIGQIQSVSLGEGRTRVDLTPRGFGTVSIDLSTNSEGVISIVMRIENPTVLNTFREARDMLEIALGVDEGGSLDFEDLGQKRKDGGANEAPYNGSNALRDNEDDTGSSSADARSANIHGSGRLNLVT